MYSSFPRTPTCDDGLDLASLARPSKLIRWSSKSQIGPEIEQQLRRLRIAIPRRFEFDSADTLAGIVEAGHGWAIMTPSAWRTDLQSSGSARVMLSRAEFCRRLRLISRAGELDRITPRLGRTSHEILREKYLPKVAQLGPWLEASLSRRLTARRKAIREGN